MKFLSKIILIVFLTNLVYSQVIFVDPENGVDSNNGSVELPLKTLKAAAEIVNTDISVKKIILKSGLYLLNEKIIFDNSKYTAEHPLIIQAEILPDDTTWMPALMPTVISVSESSKNFGFNCTLGLDIAVNHIQIKGLKFLGSPRAENYYYAVARQDSTLTDLLVSQCVFIADYDALTMQGGILAHGNKVVTENCVFNGLQNNIILWKAVNNNRNGCIIKNCIMNNSRESAVWTVAEDLDFIFKNNIVLNSENFWVHQKTNETKYKLENSYILNSKNYITSYDKGEYSKSEIGFFEFKIIKSGNIALKGKEFLSMPRNYLHIPDGTLGSELKAGLFMNKN